MVECFDFSKLILESNSFPQMDDSFKLMSFDSLSPSSLDLGSLEEIIINDNCMKMVQNFELNSRRLDNLTNAGLPSLKHIRIAKMCFRTTRGLIILSRNRLLFSL